MKSLCFLLLCVFSAFAAEDAPYVFVEQYFMKFGKKETFEAASKPIFQERKAIVIEETESPQYITLTPYTGQELPSNKSPALASTINFQVNSLHRFLSELSYLPLKSSYVEMPYLSYIIYSIIPGGEGDFENKVKALKEKENGTNYCWRVWKVIMGGDLPKYVIALFSESEKILSEKKEKILLKDPSFQDIIRRTQQGKGRVINVERNGS